MRTRVSRVRALVAFTALTSALGSGLLSYLFGWIGGLVLFLVEKDNREVRFHAAQSILLSIGMFAFWMALTVLSFIPLVGILTFLVGIVLGLAGQVERLARRHTSRGSWASRRMTSRLGSG
jgi:Predicted membrane protein